MGIYIGINPRHQHPIKTLDDVLTIIKDWHNLSIFQISTLCELSNKVDFNKVTINHVYVKDIDKETLVITDADLKSIIVHNNSITIVE